MNDSMWSHTHTSCWFRINQLSSILQQKKFFKEKNAQCLSLQWRVNNLKTLSLKSFRLKLYFSSSQTPHWSCCLPLLPVFTHSSLSLSVQFSKLVQTQWCTCIFSLLPLCFPGLCLPVLQVLISLCLPCQFIYVQDWSMIRADLSYMLPQHVYIYRLLSLTSDTMHCYW